MAELTASSRAKISSNVTENKENIMKKKGIGKKVRSSAAGHLSPGHTKSTKKAASKKFYRG